MSYVSRLSYYYGDFTKEVFRRTRLCQPQERDSVAYHGPASDPKKSKWDLHEIFLNGRWLGIAHDWREKYVAVFGCFSEYPNAAGLIHRRDYERAKAQCRGHKTE